MMLLMLVLMLMGLVRLRKRDSDREGNERDDAALHGDGIEIDLYFKDWKVSDDFSNLFWKIEGWMFGWTESTCDPFVGFVNLNEGE
jgi:hypothetical protein